MKTVRQISVMLNLQHELIRDAAGQLFKRCGKDDQFTPGEIASIREQLASWGYR